MNPNKVLAGVLIWSMGLAIPLLYHALLMHAAVQEDAYAYGYHAMVKYFFVLPWIVWPYLLATAVVGSCLVVSGLKDSATN